ncbi:hypothetical protein ACERIT_08260 [Halopenitus sp. H-Gu1]|uniref:hypothetical protein n=1 Tax=Halopenitus sp. H-Gu1 TaxID=3242697 RepID=UPI00359E4760
MSLFRKAGEKFEETKRTFMGEGETQYVCPSCEETISKTDSHCPHCGDEIGDPTE